MGNVSGVGRVRDGPLDFESDSVAIEDCGSVVDSSEDLER